MTVISEQGIPETRVELFFERPLNMCMALGVEHSLKTRECVDKATMMMAAAGCRHTPPLRVAAVADAAVGIYEEVEEKDARMMLCRRKDDGDVLIVEKQCSEK